MDGATVMAGVKSTTCETTTKVTQGRNSQMVQDGPGVGARLTETVSVTETHICDLDGYGTGILEGRGNGSGGDFMTWVYGIRATGDGFGRGGGLSTRGHYYSRGWSDTPCLQIYRAMKEFLG